MGGFLKACLRGLQGERRRGLRESARGSVFLFLRGKFVGQATLVDRSDTGARLCGEPTLLSEAEMFLVAERAEATSYEVVRDAPGGVGVRITGVRSMRGYVDPQLEPVKQAWLQLRNDSTRSPPPKR